MAEDPADDGLYDLVPDDPPTRPPVRRAGTAASAAPSQPSMPSAASVPRPVLSYHGENPSSPTLVEPEAIKNLYMPLWLLGGGVAVQVVAAFLTRSRPTLALAELGIDLLAGTALMCIGLLVAARLRGINLGSFWYALLKLAAISVAPAAALTLTMPVLRFIPLGGIVGWFGAFVLYFALLGVLFDLDQSDTWYCICIIFLVRLVVYFVMLAVA